MTTMTRLLCTWDVEGMSAELYTLMQIAAALKRIDNNRGDEEKKISNLHIDETGEHERKLTISAPFQQKTLGEKKT